MATPPHPPPNLLKRASRALRLRLGVTRITIGILLEFWPSKVISYVQDLTCKLYLRVSRALFTADVTAADAQLLTTMEFHFAPVALPMHPLPDGPADAVLATSSGGDSELVLRFLLAFWTRSTDALLLLLALRRLLGRKARALLAATMATVGAEPLNAKCGLAAVTSAVNPHPDRLFDTFARLAAGQGPLMRFEIDAVLLKKRLCPLMA